MLNRGLISALLLFVDILCLGSIAHARLPIQVAYPSAYRSTFHGVSGARSVDVAEVVDASGNSIATYTSGSLRFSAIVVNGVSYFNQGRGWSIAPIVAIWTPQGTTSLSSGNFTLNFRESDVLLNNVTLYPYPDDPTRIEESWQATDTPQSHDRNSETCMRYTFAMRVFGVAPGLQHTVLDLDVHRIVRQAGYDYVLDDGTIVWSGVTTFVPLERTAEILPPTTADVNAGTCRSGTFSGESLQVCMREDGVGSDDLFTLLRNRRVALRAIDVPVDRGVRGLGRDRDAFLRCLPIREKNHDAEAVKAGQQMGLGNAFRTVEVARICTVSIHGRPALRVRLDFPKA